MHAKPKANPMPDSLYLAPHLDDVALSCGGQIYQATQAGQEVQIVTVMAGDPPESSGGASNTPHSTSAYIEELHARWHLGRDAAAARRREDVAACAILGATPRHLSVPDCIYRGGEAGYYYQSDAQIFGAIDPRELHLVDTLAAAFRQLPQADRIVAPLGIGHHVDHLLVRAAAEQTWGQTWEQTKRARHLTYYEDYPYAEKPAARAAAFAHPPTGFAWHAETIPLTDSALEAKCRAVAAFESQISTFFADDAALRRRIAEFAHARGGERLWFLVAQT